MSKQYLNFMIICKNLKKNELYGKIEKDYTLALNGKEFPSHDPRAILLSP